MRIGEHALILEPLAEAGLLGDLPPGVLAGPVLNPFLALGRPAWSATRARLIELLRAGRARARGGGRGARPAGRPHAMLPIAIGDYVDFYSSIEHASNVGTIFRPTPSRCCPTGATCRSATTAAPAPSSSRARTCPPAGPAPAARAWRRAALRARPSGSTSSSSSASSPAPATRSARASRPTTCASTSSASCSSTTGARATSSAGSTSRSARSWASRSRPRSRRGSCRWRRSSRTASPRPRRTPSRCPTCARTRTGRSTSRSRSRSLPDGGEETVVSPHQRRRPLLDRAAAARPRDRQRHQRAPRRPLRERHDLRPRAGHPRLPARAHLGRPRPARAGRRRQRTLPRGRRHGGPARQRGAGLARRGAGASCPRCDGVTAAPPPRRAGDRRGIPGRPPRPGRRGRRARPDDYGAALPLARHPPPPASAGCWLQRRRP